MVQILLVVVEEEIKMIGNVTSIFNEIHEQSEIIANISEEHWAATEEMLSNTEE